MARRGEILGAQHCEEPQLVRVGAARGGRERDHPQIDGGHAQHVTVHGDRPEPGVMHGLAVPLMGADRTAVPQLREPGAGGAQVCHHYTATDFNQHRGTQTVGEGAEIIVRMASIGPDGPTGGYFSAAGPVPW